MNGWQRRDSSRLEAAEAHEAAAAQPSQHPHGAGANEGVVPGDPPGPGALLAAALVALLTLLAAVAVAVKIAG